MINDNQLDKAISALACCHDGDGTDELSITEHLSMGLHHLIVAVENSMSDPPECLQTAIKAGCLWPARALRPVGCA